MVPKVFEILFVLALTAPVFAIVVGVAALFVPARTKRVASTREHQTPAPA
jgi:hypothetical protein